MAPGKLTMQEAKTAAPGRKKTEAAPKSHGPSNAAAYQQYQSAVQLVQQAKYDKAIAALAKLLPSAPPELVERCRMYLATCRRQLESAALQFNTPEERYDYAVSQLNQGFYEEAREQLMAVVSDAPEADYAFYGLAVLDSITGRPQDSLSNLSKAIELNPRNRLQARTDGDFQNMVDDPRFTELLYPEIP
jgi:tetratricopeptide (TPR) repeat protein